MVFCAWDDWGQPGFHSAVAPYNKTEMEKHWGQMEKVYGYWLAESGQILDWELISALSARSAGLFGSVECRATVLQLRLPHLEINIALVLAALRAGAACALLDPESPETPEMRCALAVLGVVIDVAQPSSVDMPVVVRGDAPPRPLTDALGRADQAISQAPFVWQEDQTAFILFTTGSTGKPKGVCHSLGNLLRSAQLFVNHFGLQAGDRLLSLAPLHTMSGLRALLIPCVAEVGVGFSAARDLRSILDALAASRATHLVCGPQAVQVLARLGRHLSDAAPHLKYLLCTGAWLDEKERAALEEKTPVRVLNYYGLTETCGLVLGETPNDRRLHRLPPPCAGTNIELLPIPDSDLGELRIYAPNLFLGYLGEKLQRHTYFDSKDLVQTDEKGHLQLLGRKSQAVKSATTRLIHPLCLEGWLRNRTDVVDAAVQGVERPGGGYLVALLALAAGISEDAWLIAVEAAICRELGREYVPLEWRLTALPARTALGKIRKNSLAERIPET